MATEVEIKRLQRITVLRYANCPIHQMAEENFEDLQNKETLYKSLLNDEQNDQAGELRAIIHYSRGGSSDGGISEVEAQIIADEALARQLQEMEDLSIHEPDEARQLQNDHDGTSTELISETGESSNANNEEEATRPDGIDPDNMTYEELQTLGENIGNEGRGLSDELISYLKSSRHKSGFFLKKGQK